MGLGLRKQEAAPRSRGFREVWGDSNPSTRYKEEAAVGCGLREFEGTQGRGSGEKRSQAPDPQKGGMAQI